ncbi:MAG TPA: metallophosphoesterase [Candidatus Gallacutalibacter stercoravium]|nr:metallophosphoesterase [Candidatus Gallacutalibacter stercoravium]
MPLSIGWILWAVAALAAVALVVLFCWIQNNLLQVTRLSAPAPVEQPLRVVHLSDLHGKQFGRGNRRLIRMVEGLCPDLVVFTGDLVNDDTDDLEAAVDLLRRLTAFCPVVYVLGNHEHRYHLEERVLARLQAAGVIALRDSFCTLAVKGSRLQILGMDENQGSHEAYRQIRRGEYTYRDSGPLLRQLEAKNGVRLVLSHYPENFALIGEKSYNRYHFDVMFCGHAHGGQFILPFFGGVFAPGQGIRPRYYRGRYGDGPYLVVSRGLGNSGFPLRLFNRPNVVLVTLTPSSSDGNA